jgi:hypothetical protein
VRHTDNPLLQTLVVVVAIAAGIRLVFWLLQPVWPYLLVALALFAVLRLASWYRDRW